MSDKKLSRVRNYNISRKAIEETYKDKNGNEKTPWKVVGEKVVFEYEDGSKFEKIKLNHLPDEFYVFENTYGKDKKEEEVKQPVQQVKTTIQHLEEDTINAQDIPF